MLEYVPRAIGQALRYIKPGPEKLMYHDVAFIEVPETISLTSDAFQHEEAIPVKYTEDGSQISPPLMWRGVPARTRGMVLVIEDADSPTPVPLTHAVVLDLPPGDGALAEGAIASPGTPGELHNLGRNSFFRTEYMPPDPPPGHGPHHYIFQLYALDMPVQMKETPSKGDCKQAMRGHVLAKGQLTGIYERP